MKILHFLNLHIFVIEQTEKYKNMIQVEREKKNDSGRDRSGEVKKQAKML
jgi:hypothetical protein